MKKAAELFKTLALYKAKNKNLKQLQELRLKSAHLSLSSLDQLADREEELAHRTGLFMEEFSQNRKEFVRIYHSALLNTVKKLVSNKDFSNRPVRASSDEQILKAWETLQLLSLQEATKEETLTYQFNRLSSCKRIVKI